MTESAALPVLASTELDYQLRKCATWKRVKSGCPVIDDVLKGGLDSGRVTCISGDRALGKTTIALQFLVTHILSSNIAEAAIIDTNGTFDVVRLYQTIVLRLRESSIVADVEAKADEALQRVRIIRAFDFFGVIQAINEIRESLEKHSRLSKPSPKSARRVARRILNIVPDSEDEEDEVMIDVTDGQSHSTVEIPLQQNTVEAPSQIGLIVIDNLTSVVNPLLKTNHLNGHSVLLSFMRSFTNLTREHNIVTILINSVINNQNRINIISTTEQPAVPASMPWIQDPQDAFHAASYPSIFMSNMIKPALGRSFSHYVDTHILLSSIPKRKVDAQLFYAGVEIGVPRSYVQRKPELVTVAEIITDRWDDRIERWAGFAISDGITINPIQL